MKARVLLFLSILSAALLFASAPWAQTPPSFEQAKAAVNRLDDNKVSGPSTAATPPQTTPNPGSKTPANTTAGSQEKQGLREKNDASTSAPAAPRPTTLNSAERELVDPYAAQLSKTESFKDDWHGQDASLEGNLARTHPCSVEVKNYIGGVKKVAKNYFDAMGEYLRSERDFANSQIKVLATNANDLDEYYNAVVQPRWKEEEGRLLDAKGRKQNLLNSGIPADSEEVKNLDDIMKLENDAFARYRASNETYAKAKQQNKQTSTSYDQAAKVFEAQAQLLLSETVAWEMFYNARQGRADGQCALERAKLTKGGYNATAIPKF